MRVVHYGTRDWWVVQFVQQIYHPHMQNMKHPLHSQRTPHLLSSWPHDVYKMWRGFGWITYDLWCTTNTNFYLMLDTAQFAINYDKYIHVWNDREIGVDINWKIWHCSLSCPSTGFNWYKNACWWPCIHSCFFREYLKLSPMVWQTRRNNSLNNISCINQNQTGYTSHNIL